VGGLRDTVEDNKTGFVFEGDTPARQAANFVAAVDKALALKSNAPERWQNLRRKAAAQRFDWARSARQTIDELYQSAN
jgi:starch synthase